MLNLLASSDDGNQFTAPSYLDLFIRALKDPHSYNPLTNGFFWFGFVWGIPVPVVTLWYRFQIEDTSIAELIFSDPLQFFFMIHPVLFGFLFALMGSMVQHYIDRLREESVRDGLTGLYNHRYFRGELKRRIQESKRYDLSFCLIMVDIDHFKNVNDRYGHQKGDQVLENISNLLIKSTREADVICRYGGEEFAIITPETSRAEATELAERIRLKVENHDFDIDGNLTLSGGVSSYPEDGTADTDLIKSADERLYKAKEEGRNQIYYQSGDK